MRDGLIKISVQYFVLLAVFATLLAASPRKSDPTIVVAPHASSLVQYAAGQLAHYLTVLFGVQPTIAASPSPASPSSRGAYTFFVGTPEEGLPELRELGGGGKLAEQSLVLRTMRHGDRTSVIVSGGSSRAVLWAVYELVERWGVRYQLTGDLLPTGTHVLYVPDLNLMLAPRLPVRQWRLVNEFAAGPSSWGMEELRPLVDQLAKLRFNRLLVWIWPHQPFLDYEYGGIHRSTATMFFGFRFPISPDMIGRRLFGDHKFFANPDIPISASYPEMVRAGTQYVRALILYAKSRGMQIVMPAHLTEFPPEFAPILKDSRQVHQVGTLTITAGPTVGFDDPQLLGLADTILRRTLETYPEVDYIAFSMPEHRQWIDDYQRAWKDLDMEYRLSQVTSLDKMLDAAAQRKDFPGGPARAQAEVKGDLVNLRFYEQFMRRYPARRFVLDGVAEELYPILDRILPPGSELLNFVDYTPSRILRRREALGRIPGQRIPSVLIYTLHDDNVGLLPQLETHSLRALNDDILSHGWAGFSTRYWLLGDQESCVNYLAKAAWQAVDPDSVAGDYFEKLCGEGCRKPMLAALEHLEHATEILEWNGLGFAFPVPGMMMKHWTPHPLAPAFDDVSSSYAVARQLVQEAIAAATPEGRRRLAYWDGRLTFGIDYLDAVRELRAAAAAEAAGSLLETRAHAGAALRKITSSLEAYASVVTDRSDVGAIAVMNEFVYRPVKNKIKELNNQK